jgi:hypothetical protein
MVLEGIRWDGEEWIGLSRHTKQCGSLVSIVMNLSLTHSWS